MKKEVEEKFKISKKFETKNVNWYTIWNLFFPTNSNSLSKNLLNWLFVSNTLKEDTILWIKSYTWKFDVSKINQLIWNKWYLVLFVYFWENNQNWIEINSNWKNINYPVNVWLYRIIFNESKKWKLVLKIFDQSTNSKSIYKNVTSFEIKSWVQLIKWEVKLNSKELNNYTKLKSALLNIWNKLLNLLNTSNYETYNLTWSNSIFIFNLSNNELTLKKITINNSEMKITQLLDFSIYISPQLWKYLSWWTVSKEFVEKTFNLNQIDVNTYISKTNDQIKEWIKNEILNWDSFLSLLKFDNWVSFNWIKNWNKVDWIKILENERDLSWVVPTIKWKMEEYYIMYPWYSVEKEWVKSVKWKTIILWKLISKNWNKLTLNLFPLFDKDYWVILWKQWWTNSFYTFNDNTCDNWNEISSLTYNWVTIKIWKKITTNNIKKITSWIKEGIKKNWKVLVSTNLWTINLDSKEFDCIQKNITPPTMIFYWDTRKALQDIIVYMFTVDTSKTKIEDAIKYKYIVSIPLYWNQIIWINNWNDYYAIKYMQSSNEIRNFDNSFGSNYRFNNIWVLKVSDMNNDWKTDLSDIKTYIKKDSNWNFILNPDKKQELIWTNNQKLLNKSEIINLLTSTLTQ